MFLTMDGVSGGEWVETEEDEDRHGRERTDPTVQLVMDCGTKPRTHTQNTESTLHVS